MSPIDNPTSASRALLPILAAGPSVPAYTTDQLLAMSVEDAWHFSGDDEAVFGALVGKVAAEIAEFKGWDLPDTDASRQLVLGHLGSMLREDSAERFTFVVGKAVGMTMEHTPMPSEIVAAYNKVRKCNDKRTVCHAPSTSMYFGRNGYVTACCYSRANPLGQWPQQTVSEIWFGPKIEKMRGELQQNILPIGCETCADQLHAHNFRGLLAGNFDAFVPSPDDSTVSKLKAFFRKPEPVYPIRMEFELSNKCNLECDMCSGVFSSSIRANREGKPPLPQVFDSIFVEQLKPFIPHLKQAKFLGGEPFLIDIYYEIWELFIQLNPECEIIITTNGTVFTNKVQRMLEHLNFKVVVSLDSVTKPTYEAIRRNATMERTLENVERFSTILRERGRTMTMAVCPMVLNRDEIPGLVAFANSKGMPIFFNTVTFPTTASLKYMAHAEQVRVVDAIRKGIGPATNELEAANFRALSDLGQQVELWSRGEQMDEVETLVNA